MRIYGILPLPDRVMVRLHFPAVYGLVSYSDFPDELVKTGTDNFEVIRSRFYCFLSD